MPVRKPKKGKMKRVNIGPGGTNPTRAGKVATKKNAGVARKAGRGKLGGGVLTAPGTKRAGKPARKAPQYPGMYTPGTAGSAQGLPKKPTGGPSKKKKKTPKAR